MIIYGASGHSKVIIDLINTIGNIEIDLVIDDNQEISRILDLKVSHKIPAELNDREMVLAIGNNSIRYKLAQKLKNPFCKPIIHPNAIISSLSELGVGSVVMAGAVVNPATRIGKHCIINTGSIIEHDVELSDYVHISPGAVITGNVEIGEGTQIGAGASVIPGVKVGKWSTIGAGAVIIEDVPAFSTVVGNPGKVIKINKEVYEQR